MADDEVITQRVQELTWAMLDEELGDDEFRLLDSLLLSDDKARETYARCVQLHADLTSHFAAPSKSGSTPDGKNIVLGSLGTTIPPMSFPTPSSEKA